MSDMTSAVAIDLLDNLIGMVDDNQENDYDTALHMAINALEVMDGIPHFDYCDGLEKGYKKEG